MSSQYKLEESKLEVAITAFHAKRRSNPRTKISMKSVAGEFNVPYTTFLLPVTGKILTKHPKTRQSAPNVLQYKVLFDTIDAYVTPALIKESAEGILQHSTDPAGPRPKLSNWVYRFLEQNPEYHRKVTELRARAEDQDLDVVNKGS